jgi:pimeloyl-ACP methyl ester carboxylesterase
MERADVAGITIEYEVAGHGEPVVFIHGALIAETFRPLLTEPALTDRYHLIRYHRRGYAGSTHTRGPMRVAQHAADCRALFRYLGVERAHVVGHSYGGAVVLQLALETPDVVHSLALLEPAVVASSGVQAYRDALQRGEQRFREASAEEVVDEFFQPRFGSGYRALLDQILPGSFAQAVADAGTWFERESPALREWTFGEPELQRVTQPVLAVHGQDSDALWPRFGETHRLLLASLPQAEGFVLPGATHLLHAQNPRGMAEALAAFFARHPMPDYPGRTSGEAQR